MTPTSAAPASSITSPVDSATAGSLASSNMDLLHGLLGSSTSSTPAAPSASVITPAGASNVDITFAGGLTGLTLTPTTTAPITLMGNMPNLMMQQSPLSMPATSTVNVSANAQHSRGTWANSGVDINLDNLTLGGLKKAPAPSMNQLQTVSTTIAPVISQPHPSMMISNSMMGGRMMTPQQPQPAVAPAMNGSAVPSAMMPGMMHGAVLPGGRMPVGMPGAVPHMPANMTTMMGMVAQQPTGAMSMPSNLGL
ncbi:uncharacterized protein [Panulirus ornatus]|uniref:uncharacterized protein n=1 Tax=Panulirus ornatus TaxID=150431 RepID=UPI003A849A33